MIELDLAAFERWLAGYGEAWETRDAIAVVHLFSEDALYHWTPFDDPKRGHAGIAEAWRQATSCQEDVHFTFTVWSLQGMTGVAHWHTTFRRRSTGREVEIDGVLSAEFDPSGRCAVFREWWHSDEAGRGAGSPAS